MTGCCSWTATIALGGLVSFGEVVQGGSGSGGKRPVKAGYGLLLVVQV